MQLSSCGGGSGDGSGTDSAQNGLVESSVAVKSFVRWSNPSRIEVRAIVPATDGGTWLSGTLTDFPASSFLRKIGGANPCGGDGFRVLTELGVRFDRPNIQVALSAAPGLLLVGGTYAGGLFLTVYDEQTCQPQTSFGVNGFVKVASSGLAFSDKLKVGIDAQNRIYVAASYSGNIRIQRLLMDGTLDTTYATAGIATATISGGLFVEAIQIGTGGELYIFGSRGIPFGFVPSVVKFDIDGHLAQGFGDAGISLIPEVSKGTASVRDALIDGDRLVMIGNTANSVVFDDILTNDSFIAAINRTTGQIDKTFGTSGFTRWDWGFNSSNMVAALVRNKKFGFTTCGHRIKGLLNQSIALAEFDANGLFDNQIGTEGRRIVGDTVSGDCLASMFGSDGSLFISGYVTRDGYFASVAN
jgi:hypothetical protein